jgi:capsular exopolysaccharide synthesis family protein
MSRIEEALRRAGVQHNGTAASELENRDVDTPWPFARESAPESVPTKSGAAAVGLLEDEHKLPLAGFSDEWTGRLAVSPDVSPMLVEQFRRLAATLYHAQTAGTLKVVMVTSAWAGDGKTMTALNLALVLSESYRRRVLLVDADLRRPSISNLSAISATCGLSDGLKSQSDQKLSVLKLTETLTLLPAGRPDPDPMSSLTSNRMRRIIEEASARFDWVILDAPPVGPVADANLLAAMTDAVLLVVRANRTQYAPIQKAIESIGRDKIFGVVLNGVDELSDSEYAREYGAYAHAYDSSRESK